MIEVLFDLEIVEEILLSLPQIWVVVIVWLILDILALSWSHNLIIIIIIIITIIIIIIVQHLSDYSILTL